MRDLGHLNTGNRQLSLTSHFTAGSWFTEGASWPVCELKTCPALGVPANGTASFNHNIMDWGCGSSVR